MVKIKIRRAKIDDIPEIVKVERLTWPEGLNAETEKFESRIKNFSEGVLVAEEKNKRIVGVVVAEIINYDLKTPQNKSWYEFTDNGYIAKTHDPNGNIVFGVDLSVVPDMQNQGIATKLLEEVGKIVVRRNLVCAILGGRIPGYQKYSNELTAEEYVSKRTPNGDYFDPELNFYSSAGLKIVKLIPDYFVDPESLNWGVLIKWENPYYQKNVLLGKLLGFVFSIFLKAPK